MYERKHYDPLTVRFRREAREHPVFDPFPEEQKTDLSMLWLALYFFAIVVLSNVLFWLWG